MRKIDLELVHYKDETGKIRKFFETAEGKRVYEKLNKIKEICPKINIPGKENFTGRDILL